MKIFNCIVFTILFCSYGFESKAWGFWAHKRINKMAVFTLPPPLFGFYRKNLDYITEHAVDADKRRYASKKEAPRHYIDLDHYCYYPCDSFPKRWDLAVEKYSEDTLQAYGIVPWHIQSVMHWLTEAFMNKDVKQILRLSADLGHYIADAHVPLHTTKNYNGQLTGQKGIHGFWESRLPELFGEDYDYFAGKAVYVENPLEKTWSFIFDSHKAVDSVLSFEKELSETVSPDGIYSFENRGESMVRVYSKAYSAAYHNKLDQMVEKRLRASIIDIGSLWFTCWVLAGQPDMENLDNNNLPIEDVDEELEKKFRTGKQIGRTHPNTGKD